MIFWCLIIIFDTKNHTSVELLFYCEVTVLAYIDNTLTLSNNLLKMSIDEASTIHSIRRASSNIYCRQGSEMQCLQFAHIRNYYPELIFLIF